MSQATDIIVRRVTAPKHAGTPDEVVAFTNLGTDRTSAALTAGVTYEFLADEDCYINFGDVTVTAAAGNYPLMAGKPKYFTLTAAVYCAAIRKAVDGDLAITACPQHNLNN